MPRRHANARPARRGEGKAQVTSEFWDWLDRNPSPVNRQPIEAIRPMRKRRRAAAA